MKTINNAQKTENRKPKNTTAKTFAIVAALGLISLTVNANGFGKQISATNSGEVTALAINQTGITDRGPV